MSYRDNSYDNEPEGCIYLPGSFVHFNRGTSIILVEKVVITTDSAFIKIKSPLGAHVVVTARPTFAVP